MSIASEITRLQGVKSDILTAIADKGVTVPVDSMLDDCPDLIASIPTGGVMYENIGGRTYTIFENNGKFWTIENLDYKFDGCGIGGDGSPVTPNAWYYDNDEELYGNDGEFKCGLLYNWYAVKYLDDNKNTLIPGWHVATKAEYDELCNSCGGLSNSGFILKAKENYIKTGFPNSAWGGSDLIKFSSLPAGNYDGGGLFQYFSTRCSFWTSTEYDSSHAYLLYMENANAAIYNQREKYLGRSVRLVKDY